jgi:UDP-N-acetylmuramate--alanine ligase
MSAIARHYLRRDVPVFGYDKVASDLTRALEAEGAIITYSEDTSTYPGWPEEYTEVIYTPAIPERSVWRQFFADYRPIKRARALANLANDGRCLAVAGTHGKTSTSAMLVHILERCGMDPTAFIGGIMTETGTNYRLGASDLFIVEADEFDRSFLQLQPWAAAITTTDEDHLDIYSDGNDLLNTFEAFVAQVSGPTFTAKNVLGTEAVGIPGSTAWTSDVRVQDGAFTFTLHLGNELHATALHMPGEHNVYNATLAAALAHHAGAQPQDIAEALKSFKGIKRRFEYHLNTPDRVLIEDYAHHPTEIAALIDSIEALYPEEPVCLCFQPHLFSRTRDFMEGFIDQLSRVDQCILLPIYAAREQPIEGISSEILARGIKCAIVVQPNDLPEAVRNINNRINLVVGAGDIGLCVEPLKAVLS